jgi:DNA-binding response OmpR family regulator
MTTKTSEVLAAAIEILAPEIQAGPAPFERMFPFGSEPLTHERIRQLELDSFQVALVPYKGPDAGADKHHARNSGTNELLLLPVNWKQLMAQLRKETNRATASAEAGVVRFGEIIVDLVAVEVRRLNRLVNLTAMEFKVLKYFVSNPNRAISRNDLLDQVWGYENYPCTRTVDNHILRLRQKLEVDFANPVHFLTVHGVGYKFTP